MKSINRWKAIDGSPFRLIFFATLPVPSRCTVSLVKNQYKGIECLKVGGREVKRERGVGGGGAMEGEGGGGGGGGGRVMGQE